MVLLTQAKETNLGYTLSLEDYVTLTIQKEHTFYMILSTNLTILKEFLTTGFKQLQKEKFPTFLQH